jgi:hypothetical protein
MHNTFATVWKIVLSVFFALLFSELAVWGLLNYADSDVLGICITQVSAFFIPVLSLHANLVETCAMDLFALLSVACDKTCSQQNVGMETSHTLPNGDVIQEVQDKPPNKNAHCSVLKLAGGLPAGVALAVAIIGCMVLWFTKTKNVEQLSSAEMVNTNPLCCFLVVAF